jgi:hypothetical protein
VRRRRLEFDAAPAELMDPRRWARCERWDGGDQPCLCWFSEAQQKFVDDGNEWPGGETQMFADYVKVQRDHKCERPFDWSVI